MPEYIQDNPGSTTAQAELIPKRKLSEDYDSFKSRVDQLLKSWDVEFKATEYRRRVKKLSVNVQELRSRQQLKPYETFIPIRLTETNIKREQPARIAFLKQSPRISIFKNPLDPSSNNDRIESDFTRVNQYLGWETAFFKCDDGAATHGWDALELEMDYDNPGGFRWEHVGHEYLVFALDSTKFQANEIVIRIIPVSVSQLRDLTLTYGFNSVEVEKVIGSVEKASRFSQTTDDVPTADAQRLIYKVFHREDGIVKVSWYAKECSVWLKEPVPLYLGVMYPDEIQPTIEETTQALLNDIPILPKMRWVEDFETDFPFVIQYYEETEEKCLKEHKGRVFKDEYKQEALCAIWSSYVNGCILGSNVMASPKNPQGGGAPKQNQNFVVEMGKIWTEPMEFFNTPFPNPSMLDAALKLDVQNADETNQVNFAVANRKDSRKTAREVDVASQQQSLLNGVNVTMYSVFIRECCQKSWRLVNSFASQNKIKFLVLSIDPETEQVINDIETINQPWELFAAGDVDVIQRAEKLQRQLAMWPLVAETPLAMTYLIDMLKNAFPDDASRYEKELREFQAMQQQVTLMRNQLALKQGLDKGTSPLLDGANAQTETNNTVNESMESEV